MLTCEKCSRLGSGYWESEPAIKARQPIKRADRHISIRTVSSPFVVPENLEIIKGFGLIVRNAREKNGLSHEDLGRKMGEKVSVIKKIESEKIVPDHGLAARLENSLKIKLIVPVVDLKTPVATPPPISGVTIGEIVHLKTRRRRQSKDESDRGPAEKSV